MQEKLQEIIKNSSFRVIPGTFLYLKTASVPQGKHFAVMQDEDEITVVTKKDAVSGLKILEQNKDERNLIEIKVSIPFNAVGFLASVSGAIADNGMNVLVVSTYSKDYILVKTNCLEEVREILLNLGFSEEK